MTEWFDLKRWSHEDKNRALVILTLAAWCFQVLYTLSPIDLIPDFIPFIGILDDLLGLAGVISMTGYVIHMLRNGGAETLLGKEGVAQLAKARASKRPVVDRPAPVDYEPMDPTELRNL